LFPRAFTDGYRLQDVRTSGRTGPRLRRLRLKATGESFSVRPSFVLPSMAGQTDDVQGPLFPRAFGVPFWALARVFGKNALYGYRREVRLGRHSVVGTTVRRVDVPAPLLADEHHQSRDGTRNYIATTVGEGCCLGSAWATTAHAEDLTAAYAIYRQEAENVQPGYRPPTVSVEGWASTHQAWRALFPLVALLRCFLHGGLNLRSRGKLTDAFAELSRRVWEAYRAPDRRALGQRWRRLAEWARARALSAWLLEQVEKLCGRSKEYGAAYGHPGGHRTSNVLDRVMRGMNRYFDSGQHLHGHREACELHCRAWALLCNFRPWHPAVARANAGWRGPAERLNRHRYHDDWLQNLLASGSLGGFRR
jgi:hypothetical protein